MSFIKKSYCFFLAIFFLSACVSIKQATLYDGVEPEEKVALPDDISLIVESRIYDDDVTDVWGIQKDVCQEVQVSDVAYSGNESLQLTWDRNAKGCDFSGIGIGWDGWAGKDLSLIMSTVAIQMHVRTQKGKAFGLPMVLTLIDYSEGMGFLYTTNKYFERVAIDEEWQKVTVPLSDFEITKENLDPTNIKQLQIELQQSGSVYLDDISLVFYEPPPPQTPWLVEEKLTDPIATPKVIFDDEFANGNGWGLIDNNCKTIEWTDQESNAGKKSLHLRWDSNTEGCSFNEFGVSWNKWKPVDMTSIRESVAIEFDVKTVEGTATEIPLKIGFEDYKGGKAFVSLAANFLEGNSFGKAWQKVRVPLTAIPSGVDFKNIKQAYFEMTEKGEIFLDNFRLEK